MDSYQINNHYKEDLDFMKQMNFFSKWEECERFKRGKQWGAITEKTKNLPRPVINIIRFIENHKCANIINDPVKMVFSPDELDGEDQMAEVGAELFTQYSATEWDNVNQDRLNEKALDKASNLGTAIWHYYWDTGITGGSKKVKYVGGLAGEIIDDNNCLVGNPQQQDTQKQPHILITGRDTVENVQALAKQNGIDEVSIRQIQGDSNTENEGYSITKKEIKEKVTVITAYWKELIPPMAYPTVQMAKVCNEVFIKKPVNTMHKLYPIVSMQWYERDKCWYGIGDTEGLINNQKSINLMVAMQMMSEQLTGMPKLMLKQGYISNYNNDPASAILDNNPNGWSAQYLQPAQQSSKTGELVSFLIDNSKTLAGASETSTGDVTSMSNLSPTVVVSLQQQSQIPIESMKKRYKRAMQDIGEIWEEFWTINYNTTKRIMVNKLNPQTGQEEEQPQDFKGTDFKDVGIKLKIEIGTSKGYSDQLVATALDQLFEQGIIDGQTKVELYPESVLPCKDEVLKKLPEIQARKQQQQMEQLQQNIPNQVPQTQ